MNCSGRHLFQQSARERWIDRLDDAGTQLRARLLFAELDVQTELRKQAKSAMVVETRRHRDDLRSIESLPGFGVVRTAQLLATVQTPARFANRRAFRSYVGLSVVTRSSSDYVFGPDGIRRRVHRANTRGLTRDFNRRLKNVFKGAALSASRRGPLTAYYQALVASGRKPEIARVIVARRLALAALSIWKRGEVFDEKRFLASGARAVAGEA
jgi:transposase